MNSGAVRSDLDIGSITYADVLTVLPFGNSVDMLTLYGRTVRKLLEKSAALLSKDSPNTEGGFIQVSGKSFEFCMLSIQYRQQCKREEIFSTGKTAQFQRFSDFKHTSSKS